MSRIGRMEAFVRDLNYTRSGNTSGVRIRYARPWQAVSVPLAEYVRGKKMIYYDGQEWRDPEELLHMAGMESGEKYEEACRYLAQEGYDL